MHRGQDGAEQKNKHRARSERANDGAGAMRNDITITGRIFACDVKTKDRVSSVDSSCEMATNAEFVT